MLQGSSDPSVSHLEPSLGKVSLMDTSWHAHSQWCQPCVCACVSVCVCVAWQASCAQARFSRAEGGQASGEGGASPGLCALVWVVWKGFRWQRNCMEGAEQWCWVRYRDRLCWQRGVGSWGWGSGWSGMVEERNHSCAVPSLGPRATRAHQWPG